MATTKRKSESTLTSFTPVAILRSAIDAVPAMRYALGVGGLAAIVAIIVVGWKLEAQTAVFGTLIVLVFMVSLVIFAALAGLGAGVLKPLALFLAWSFLVLMVAVATLFVSCAFFDKPKSLPCLLRNECSETSESKFAQEPPGISAVEPTTTQTMADTATTIPIENEPGGKTGRENSVEGPTEPKANTNTLAEPVPVKVYLPYDMIDADILYNGTPARVRRRLLSFVEVEALSSQELAVFTAKTAVRTCEQRLIVDPSRPEIYICEGRSM